MSDLTHDICWKCDGSGQLQNNTHDSEAGTYTFGKIQCDECGGRGQIDYLKCDDCSAVVPAHCFIDHECGD